MQDCEQFNVDVHEKVTFIRKQVRQIVEIYERNLVIVIDIIQKSTLQEEAFTVAEKEEYVAIPELLKSNISMYPKMFRVMKANFKNVF